MCVCIYIYMCVYTCVCVCVMIPFQNSYKQLLFLLVHRVGGSHPPTPGTVGYYLVWGLWARTLIFYSGTSPCWLSRGRFFIGASPCCQGAAFGALIFYSGTPPCWLACSNPVCPNSDIEHSVSPLRGRYSGDKF